MYTCINKQELKYFSIRYTQNCAISYARQMFLLHSKTELKQKRTQICCNEKTVLWTTQHFLTQLSQQSVSVTIWWLSLLVVLCSCHNWQSQISHLDTNQISVTGVMHEQTDTEVINNTYWNSKYHCVKNDMKSLGLSQKDAQSRNKWRRRIKGATG